MKRSSISAHKKSLSCDCDYEASEQWLVDLYSATQFCLQNRDIHRHFLAFQIPVYTHSRLLGQRKRSTNIDIANMSSTSSAWRTKLHFVHESCFVSCRLWSRCPFLSSRSATTSALFICESKSNKSVIIVHGFCLCNEHSELLIMRIALYQHLRDLFFVLYLSCWLLPQCLILWAIRTII